MIKVTGVFNICKIRRSSFDAYVARLQVSLFLLYIWQMSYESMMKRLKNSKRLSLASTERSISVVLTSFSKAQENVIDVLPLDGTVISGQILSIFWKHFDAIRIIIFVANYLSDLSKKTQYEYLKMHKH